MTPRETMWMNKTWKGINVSQYKDLWVVQNFTQQYIRYRTKRNNHASVRPKNLQTRSGGHCSMWGFKWQPSRSHMRFISHCAIEKKSKAIDCKGVDLEIHVAEVHQPSSLEFWHWPFSSLFKSLRSNDYLSHCHLK